MNTIPTYIINLKEREDRKAHIQSEFADRPEFHLNFVEACRHEIGAIGLWKSICGILNTAIEKDYDYVLICEDDHVFTADYSPEYLDACIRECISQRGNVLLGATSWFDSAIKVSDNLHWVGWFTGTQFMIIFKELYHKMLDVDFGNNDHADWILSLLDNRKFFMSRHISEQKFFGYSDITERNGTEGRLEELFGRSALGVETLSKVMDYYADFSADTEVADDDIKTFMLPVYLLDIGDGGNETLNEQFNGRDEFLVHQMPAVHHERSRTAYWIAIKQAIEKAIADDEDVVILCNKHHVFSEQYTKEYLFKNIIQAHYQGVDLLAAGYRALHRAYAISRNRYWIAYLFGSPFLVVYRKFFQKVLAEIVDENVDADSLLSEMAFNKMILYPSISEPIVTSEEEALLARKSKFKLRQLKEASREFVWQELNTTL